MAGEDLRAVMRRFPTGVAVVTVDAGGQRVGLTVASLVTLSLDPPLVGVAVARQAALHELLREAGGSGSPCSPRGRRRSRSTSPAACRRSSCGPASRSSRATARRCSRARSAGSGARSARCRTRARTASSWRGRRGAAGLDAPPLVRLGGDYRPRDRGGRLRPRRRAARLRAGLGRGPRAARPRARRPLERTRAAGHDGDELARVVALHARRGRPARVAGRDQRRGRAPAARSLPSSGCRSSRARSRRCAGSPPNGRSASRPPRTGR